MGDGGAGRGGGKGRGGDGRGEGKRGRGCTYVKGSNQTRAVMFEWVGVGESVAEWFEAFVDARCMSFLVSICPCFARCVAWEI